jgi:hypothetical protein
MHLNAEQLIDVAEGTSAESGMPHLAACEACRAQLRELRAMMAAAQAVDVPEPSPLFWDQLSSRVRQAVTADPAAPRLHGARGFVDVVAALVRTRAFLAGTAIAAGLLLAIALGSRPPLPAPAGRSPVVSVAEATAAPELLGDVTPDDASLTLVASLTDGVDMETAREAGLAPRGSAEHAVTHMSEGELRELGRLLQEELTRSGA